MALRFDTDFDPRHGELVEVSPLLRRIVCANPSKYTFHGTGTYVIGRGDVAVVDPGPDPAIDETHAAHVAALLAGLSGESVSHILITHTHGDHSPAARAVAAATGAPLLGFGPHPATAAAEDDEAGENADGAESPRHHADVDFAPDTALGHGDVVSGRGWTVEALHTPGHISNHLCFALREESAVLSGDHVMGWSSTVIPPPDGDIGDYLRSLRLLLDRDDRVLYPTHGGPVTDPAALVRGLYDHRLDREAEIVAQLWLGPRTVAEIVAVLYADVREELHKPAGRSVLAHLHKLRDDRRARTLDDRDPMADDARWAAI